MSDNIYYNASVYATEERKLAKFEVNRVAEILKNPNDYEVGIARFRIPRTDIPFFTFEDDTYKVTLSIESGGTIYDYTLPLVFIPNGTDNQLFVQQEFINSLNACFFAVFTMLINLHGTIASDSDPKAIYLPESNLSYIEVQQSYITDNIKVYFNKELSEFFPSMQYKHNGEQDKFYEVIVGDRVTNIGTLNSQPSYLMYEQSPGSASWSDLLQIRFETMSIPVVHELEGGQKNVQEPILTDFNIPNSVRYDTSDIVYNPQSDLRWLSMNSSYPLKKMDFQIYYVTKTGKYPLYLNIGESLSVKFRFRRKLTEQIHEHVDSMLTEHIEDMKVHDDEE